MPEVRGSKVRSPGLNGSVHLSAILTCVAIYKLAVACERHGDKPPGMIVDRPISVAGQKPMHAQGDAAPEDPALKVGMVIVAGLTFVAGLTPVKNGVVGETELETPQIELH